METQLVIHGVGSDDDLRIVINAIQDLPCIGHVELDPASGKACIEHQPMVSEADIRQAIEQAGYRVD
ncbi:heavy metal-associated domain-containing protein [Chitinivorax sp. B]|uniref:heavy-metal-associated domain-containing protein n=1 Tax=Chitinivorax sp. B TaxID=2502235 RepID=UPI0010F52E1D|nr:heavy metal-associated domain-containing protein [Chitinivorax sp. B]